MDCAAEAEGGVDPVQVRCQLIVSRNQGKQRWEVDYILVACLWGGLFGAAVTLRGIRARN